MEKTRIREVPKFSHLGNTRENPWHPSYYVQQAPLAAVEADIFTEELLADDHARRVIDGWKGVEATVATRTAAEATAMAVLKDRRGSR